MIFTNLENKIEFYSRPEFVDNPYHPAGFKGTFAFSDHSLIPDVFVGFLMRHFGRMRLKRVPISEINDLLNSVWDGPGSLEKIFRLEAELAASGKDIVITPMDYVKSKTFEEDDTPLADNEYDASSEEFEFNFDEDDN